MNIPVHYVFVVRHYDQWTKPVVIRQDYLRDHLESDKIGSEHDGNLNLYFSYSTGNDNVECSGLNLTRYLSDFSDFPLIEE